MFRKVPDKEPEEFFKNNGELLSNPYDYYPSGGEWFALKDVGLSHPQDRRNGINIIRANGDWNVPVCRQRSKKGNHWKGILYKGDDEDGFYEDSVYYLGTDDDIEEWEECNFVSVRTEWLESGTIHFRAPITGRFRLIEPKEPFFRWYANSSCVIGKMVRKYSYSLPIGTHEGRWVKRIAASEVRKDTKFVTDEASGPISISDPKPGSGGESSGPVGSLKLHK